ncbi:AAA family ATPase [Pseudomonas syringae]|nr:AAA family ATPase [Pseudomonas syringae]MBD8573062.1 AAA family ATPase [Pseudomonas syringae]MBD8790427.1 AAA family ATPase [Pseudomonas syringae]MBD8799075.1 AAA family ATPase [Pseudomonas syringae]MBD8809901.1 AAA family ATPase [Pseudomonas syringae]
MLHTLAVENYRSLHDLQLSLGRLTVVTGANGSGKSNLYRALRLLADTAREGVVQGIAREGGLDSCFWAGPEQFSAAVLRGEQPVQGLHRRKPQRMRLGFAGEHFSYALSLGLPEPSPGESSQRPSLFGRDPQIKREVIWAGPVYRPASVLVERKGPSVRMRSLREWRTLTTRLPDFYSLFDTGGAIDCPEIETLRNSVRDWRFYDHFRTDATAPARQPQVGTRTPVLHHSGRDLAAALQTIREIGDPQALDAAIDDAFPGSTMHITVRDGLFGLALQQPGMLRPLLVSELSDGTLRYLLLVAALLTPRPPALMVLNEPESSLHPDLLPALARLIGQAAERGQVWVVSHASRLVAALEHLPACVSVVLEKPLGQTQVKGQQGLLDGPAWQWPS